MNKQNKIKRQIGKYNLEFRHITVLALILIFFVWILMFLQRASVHDMLAETQHWYQRHSAEILANTNSTSIELLIENMNDTYSNYQPDKKKLIQSFNIILTQQLLDNNIKDVCIFVKVGDSVVAIDNGQQLFEFLSKHKITKNNYNLHLQAKKLVLQNYAVMDKEETIVSFVRPKSVFEILVPFAPRGEFTGIFYMKSNPDFSTFTSEFLSNYNQMAMIYLSLILLSLLTMYYVSTYTVRQRDRAQKKLFDEHQERLKTEIEHNKESVFTKRIYHTHHKAEKVMGFIKEDLKDLNINTIDEIKSKLNKYANFVAHAIYDMKWYDPPIQTIRSQLFKTNINELINFIVENIFLRVTSKMENLNFELNLSKDLPLVNINEFVVWEIIEPLIQNSIDHSPNKTLIVAIATEFDAEKQESRIIISDNGNGLSDNLIKIGKEKIQRIFIENVTTKNVEEKQAGYGCFIAYQLAVKSCGWKLKAENLEIGCRFIITIKK